jgi:hypothetical protein
MRCECCNRVLSDFEATRKIKSESKTPVYADMCNKCASSIEDSVRFVGRPDLDPNMVADEDLEDEEDE